VHTGSARERTYLLRAETRAEMEQWMAAIDQEKQAAAEAGLAQLALDPDGLDLEP